MWSSALMDQLLSKAFSGQGHKTIVLRDLAILIMFLVIVSK